MEAAIFNSESKSDITLLMNLAKKLGLKTKRLTQVEIEDMAIANAIKSGRTGEFVNTDDFLKKISK